MSESVDGAVVGIVGDASAAVRSAVEAAGAERVTGATEAVLAADPDRLVAVGPESLPALVAEGVPASPVLPVDAGPGTQSVPATAAAAGIESFLTGEFEPHTTTVLDVAVDGRQRTRAIADVMLVTAEPARISEYDVRSGAERVADFRADAVVVATPLGSHGYARRVDGPVVARGTGVLAVVPVAPFATDADHWVLPDDGLELRVARDEHDVELHADDRTVGPISAGVPVTVSAGAPLTLARVPEGRPTFDGGD